MKPVYDLDGTNEKFKKTEEFMVFQTDQHIRLSYPGFLHVKNARGEVDTEHELKVSAWIMSAGEEVERVLTLSDEPGATFKQVKTYLDDESKSEALIKARETKADFDIYDPELCNVIQINAFGSGEGQLGTDRFRVVVTYQRFKMDPLESMDTEDILEPYDGDGPRYSPALMTKVLARLDALEGSDQSLFGTSMGPDDILDEDPTGSSPENFVKYERHNVNTAAGINLIQPSRGSFYPTNLEILKYVPQPFTLTSETAASGMNKLFFYTDTETVIDSAMHVSTEYKVVLTPTIVANLLTKFGGQITGRLVDLTDTKVIALKLGVDYELDQIDIPRTARSTSTQGVYQNIRFLTALTSEVLVSYQAFGGMVGPADIREMHQKIDNTKSIVTNAGLITEKSIQSNPFLIELDRRMRRIEEYHNHFSQVEHRVSIKTPGLHWFSIATLYDVNWSTKISDMHDIGQFRIQSALRKWTYEFMVDVDLNRDPGDEIQLKTLGSNQHSGCSVSKPADLLARDTIVTRLCWINDGEKSGLVLQIGWDFKAYQDFDYPVPTDTIVVTNKSGSASLWKLTHNPDENNHPVNGTVAVYNHLKYVETSDRTVKEGKDYYIYRDMYVYIRTADKYIKEGKKYFSYTKNEFEEEAYVQLDSSTNENFVPGNPTSLFEQTFDDGTTAVNLFEQILYGHYPVKWTAEVGTMITGDVFELSPNSFEDTAFQMPNTSMIWSETSADSKSCNKIIEPNSGVVAWIGNMSLKDFCPQPQACDVCKFGTNSDGSASPYKVPSMFAVAIQKILLPQVVKGVTVVAYDRVDGKFVYATADAGKAIDHAEAECLISAEDMVSCVVGIHKVAMTDSSGMIHTDEGHKYRRYDYYNAKHDQDMPKVSLFYISIRPYMGSLSLDNDRYDLRQVRLHF